MQAPAIHSRASVTPMKSVSDPFGLGAVTTLTAQMAPAA
jgi:hypothetical protein